MTVAIAIMGGSIPLVLLGLLYWLLRKTPIPVPSDPRLSQLQRIEAARSRAAVRFAPLMIKGGLLGLAVSGSILAVDLMAR